MRRRIMLGVACLVALALVACGASGFGKSSSESTTSLPSTPDIVSAQPTTAPVPSLTPPSPPIAKPTVKPHVSRKPVDSSPVHATTTVRRPATRTLLVERLHGVGSARQVISVVASGYGTSSATLQGFTKTSAGWRRTFGPWAAHIGRRGFAPPGDKREGDLRTPSGSYGFEFMFGVKPNPGVAYEYRRVTGNWHVWADDPGTSRYNLWSDTRTQYAGPSPEPMNNAPAYNYSAVIGYNTARTSGLGSAIFLHVSTGGGTAGCVSLTTSRLLSVLRWLSPSMSPRIIMGTESAIT
jgi:L,D-peptidoglycan transpeptidase YkuD (ErfK/YbiS/YcfS/YnhG family)